MQQKPRRGTARADPTVPESNAGAFPPPPLLPNPGTTAGKTIGALVRTKPVISLVPQPTWRQLALKYKSEISRQRRRRKKGTLSSGTIVPVLRPVVKHLVGRDPGSYSTYRA